MTTQIPEFQQYQLAFTAHLRNPQQHSVPAGVSSKRMAVYDEIVFNNLLQSVSACFPVASAVLGKRQWNKLVQRFMRRYSADSPYFRDIPKQFLDFLQAHAQQLTLPPYVVALCHYEWIELYVSALAVDEKLTQASHELDLTAHIPVLNPTLQLLQYDYAVHKISPRKKPTQTSPTQLIVYRDSQHIVKFVEINTVTYQLMTLIQSQHLTGTQALLLLAQQLGHPEPQVIIQFGLSILDELKSQEIIVGAIHAAKPA